MARYSLDKIEAIEGKQQFYKLVIDAKCQFDEYEENIKKHGRYLNELGTIFLNMEEMANNRTLPAGKVKKLKGSKDGVTEYEFRTKHLRVYAIKIPNGKLVILGGYKNRQPKDIRKFRKTKEAYLKNQL